MAVESVSMHVVDVSALKAGAVIPTPIYDAFNPALLLIGAGTQLTESTLTRLKARGITRVIVDSKHAAEIAPDSVKEKAKPKEAPRKKITGDDIRKGGKTPLSEWIREPEPVPPSPEQTKRFAEMRELQEAELQETLMNVSQGLTGKTGKLKSLSVSSCEMILEDMDLYVKMAIDPSEDNEAYNHSLRASQLAMAIAATLGKSCENIADLGIGCLIARAGQTEKAQNLIGIPRRLTDAEWLEIQKTPARTFDMMEKCPDVPVGARQVAYQMFERWDGSGYPRGRSGSQIHPLARIASVADAYAALTSGRPHRPPFSPYRAIETILNDTRKGMFEPEAVRGLLKTVCLYPVGSRVRLSDESKATVLRTKKDSYDRPILEITHGPDGKRLGPEIVDLADREDLSIVGVIEDDEIDEGPTQLTLRFEAY